MKKKNSVSYILLTLVMILVFVFGAGCTFIAIKFTNYLGNNKKSSSEANNITYSSCGECKSGTMIVNNTGIAESVSKVYDAVVMVKNIKNNTSNGSGSGFVYKKDDKYGYVMTNYHVVDKATSIEILTASGEYVEGKVLGGDEYLDVAVIQIPADKVISVAKIGSTEELKLGEQIFAIGTPVGEEYFNSVTSGYVSGLDRKVTVSVKTKDDWVQEVVQIDASINPGNSGGPLLNYNGEVIGINSMKLVDSSIEGMGFAIKIDDAMAHVEEFEKGGSIKRPYFGISHANVTDTYALRRYGINIDSDIESGIVIIDVEKNSGAGRAGLKKGDVITNINDDKVTNIAFLKYLLYKYKIGDTIEVTYIRGSKVNTVKVTLTENTN